MATDSKIIYQINDLSFSYGKQKVIKNLSLTLTEGKVITLIGANGCGKSTLFNLMTKNLQADEGDIFFREEKLADIKLKEFAKQVAIVHQYHTVPADLTVEKLIAYGRTPHHSFGRPADTKLDEEKIRWAMEVTHTLKHKEKPVSQLSGGQKQRVWIAMSLAQDTKILFLDEPTTYLDVRYQIQILRLIRKLNEKYGITIVMVLHDMNQSLYYSDEIVAMKDGKIIAQGSPEEVIDDALVQDVYGIQLDIENINGKPFVIPV